MPQLSTLPTPSIIPSPDTHSCPLRPPRPVGVPSGVATGSGQGGQGRWPGQVALLGAVSPGGCHDMLLVRSSVRQH